MSNENTLALAIRQRIEQAFAAEQFELEIQGNKALLVLCAPELAGLSRVKQQQAVYACLNDLLASGELHAVSMRLSAPPTEA